MPSSTQRARVSLTRHRAGEAGPAVVVDFVKFSGDRSAADLVAEALPRHEVLRADPVADLSGGPVGTSIEELADAYAAVVAEQAPTCELVVGYCSAAPLAIALTRSLCATTDVPLLLIAPGFPVPAHVVDDLIEIRQTLGVADPDRTEGLPDDKVQALARVQDVLASDLHEAAVAMGASEAEMEVLTQELGGRYLAWLGYLVSCLGEQPDWLPADLRVVAMPEAWAAPRGGWPSTAAVQRSTLSREQLLTEGARLVAADLMKSAIGDLA